jgi:hypothetical protein
LATSRDIAEAVPAARQFERLDWIEASVTFDERPRANG